MNILRELVTPLKRKKNIENPKDKIDDDTEQIELVLKILNLPKKHPVEEEKKDSFTISNCFSDMEKSFDKLIDAKYNSSFHVLEHFIEKSRTAKNMSSDPEKINEYKSVYGKEFDINSANKISINQIVRYLYPELRKSLKKSANSRSLEEDTNTITKALSLRKKTIYCNFIYGKNNKTKKFEFVFGKINKKQLQNKQFILNELGTKHLQLARGYHLYYAGTCIFVRENDHFSIVVNTRSGKWFDIMEDIIPKLDIANYWDDILGKYKRGPNEKMFKYAVLDLLTIKKVENLLKSYLETMYKNAMNAVKIYHPECYYMNIINLYASTNYNDYCTLDISDIIKIFNDQVKV